MKINHLATVAIAIGLSSNIAIATDLTEIREKCIAYGASPGSAEFFTCMRELDLKETNKEQFQQHVKECNKQRMDFYFSGGIICKDTGHACPNRYADEQVRQCIKDAELMVFGKRAPTTRCKQVGNQIVCENE